MPRPRGDVLQERHHVLGLLGTAEGHQQQRVVRRDVGAVHVVNLGRQRKRFGRGRSAVLDWAGHAAALLLPPGPRDARRPALLGDRPGGAAADLHGGTGHRLPGPGRTGSYGVAGSVSAAYMVANALLAIAQGRLVDTLGQRVVLAAASVASGSRRTAHRLGAGRLADRHLLRRRGRRPARPSRRSGSAVRARWTHVLAAPADLQTAFALEAVVDEAVFIARPDPRHGAGHRGRPGGRAGHRRGRSAPSAASPSPPSAAPSRRPSPTTTPPGRAPRCRGGPCCPSPSCAPRSASCSAPPR